MGIFFANCVLYSQSQRKIKCNEQELYTKPMNCKFIIWPPTDIVHLASLEVGHKLSINKCHRSHPERLFKIPPKLFQEAQFSSLTPPVKKSSNSNTQYISIRVFVPPRLLYSHHFHWAQAAHSSQEDQVYRVLLVGLRCLVSHAVLPPPRKSHEENLAIEHF